jgi:hypothetical protein
MSSKEAARFERRATRALRALWGARHELLRTLYTLLDSENREDSTRHVGTGTNLPALLCKHYVEPIKVESYSPQILELTGRSQSNAISLLHLLVEDGACAAHWCSAGIPDVGDDSGATSTMVERLVPRLISIVDCSARMPDSFLLKAGARAAAPLLKTLAGCCLLTGSTEGGLTAENSRMQQREKRNWCGGGDSLAWVMKVRASAATPPPCLTSLGDPIFNLPPHSPPSPSSSRTGRASRAAAASASAGTCFSWRGRARS